MYTVPIAWLRMSEIFQSPSFDPTVSLKTLLKTSGSFAFADIAMRFCSLSILPLQFSTFLTLPFDRYK
jgi:hypothetical protein